MTTTFLLISLQTANKLRTQLSQGSGRKPPHTSRDQQTCAVREGPHPSFSAHFAFMARRIAFGAGAAAAFFMPLRIARIAFAILKRGLGRQAAVASSLAEILLEAK